MKGLINMIMGSGMDEFASEENSSLAMILATVGIPTNDPETRIFFSDIDSCRQFANLYKVLFLQGNLNQENINRLVDAVQSGKTSGYGIVPMNLEVEVDTEYAGYPQFIRQSSRKTELLNKKAEQLELNLA